VAEAARRAEHAGVALPPGERRVQAAVRAVGETVQVQVAGRAGHAIPGVRPGGIRPQAEVAPPPVGVLGETDPSVARPRRAVAELEASVRRDDETGIGDAAEVHSVKRTLHSAEAADLPGPALRL